jgi:hypothetical protein
MKSIAHAMHSGDWRQIFPESSKTHSSSTAAQSSSTAPATSSSASQAPSAADVLRSVTKFLDAWHEMKKPRLSYAHSVEGMDKMDYQTLLEKVEITFRTAGQSLKFGAIHMVKALCRSNSHPLANFAAAS